MKRDKVLETASEYINGQRAKDYGDAFDNFTRIADGWNLIVRSSKHHGLHHTSTCCVDDGLGQDGETAQ